MLCGLAHSASTGHVGIPGGSHRGFQLLHYQPSSLLVHRVRRIPRWESPWVSAVPLPTQLPASARKAAEEGSSAWDPEEASCPGHYTHLKHELVYGRSVSNSAFQKEKIREQVCCTCSPGMLTLTWSGGSRGPCSCQASTPVRQGGPRPESDTIGARAGQAAGPQGAGLALRPAEERGGVSMRYWQPRGSSAELSSFLTAPAGSLGGTRISDHHGMGAGP